MKSNSGIEQPSVKTPRNNKPLAWLVGVRKKQLWIVVMATILLVIVAIFVIAALTSSHRSESYKAGSGVAGLDATIAYACDQPCEQNYDFNVYFFKDNGQQIGVVKPNSEGHVNMALPEGNYIMVVGRQFGSDKLFPQEPLVLKNGQTLELKLNYR